MSVRKAQNRARKQYGIGKIKLHKRMSNQRNRLKILAYRAQWPEGWGGPFTEETKEEMHHLVDTLAADCIIATAYAEAERAERDSG